MILKPGDTIFLKMWYNLRDEWYKTLDPKSVSLPTIVTYKDEQEKYLLEVHKVKLNYKTTTNGEPAQFDNMELLMSDEEAVAFLMRWS